MDAAKIIKELQALYKKNSPFKEKEQSDEAFAIIARYCRDKGNYDKIIETKKAAEELIAETKELFQQSEDEYAKFLSDWNEVKNASEKAKILAALGNKTEFALASFNKVLQELQVKKQTISAARKAYFEKCTAKINAQKEIVKAQDLLLQEIDKCIEEVRIGLGVADYGIDSLQKTERFFELGISRTLKGEKSSFNTLGCTLFFSQNRKGVWEYDNFSTIVNESLFEQSKLTINSAIQNKETGSFLLSIKGDLNLSVLDIKKRKESETSNSTNVKETKTSIVKTDSGVVNNQVNQNLQSDHNEKFGTIQVDVMNANQTEDGKSVIDRKLDDKTMTVTDWDQRITQVVEEKYSEVTHIVTTINQIRTLLQTKDKLVPKEQKSLLDKLNDLWNSPILNGAKKYIEKIPRLGKIIKSIDFLIKGINFIDGVISFGKDLYNSIFGSGEPEFKLTDREITEIKDNITRQENEIMVKQGYKKITSNTANKGYETVDSKRALTDNITSDYNTNANQNKLDVNVQAGLYNKNTNTTFTGSDITTDKRQIVENQNQKTTDQSNSNRNLSDFNSNEDDITITDQFLLVLICETAKDGLLIVHKDSSSDLGPIEKGIKPKLKHDNDLEISFSLMTKELYN